MLYQQQTLEHVEAVVESLEEEKTRLERRIARSRALPERQARRVERLKALRPQLEHYHRVHARLKRSTPVRRVEPLALGHPRRGYLFD